MTLVRDNPNHCRPTLSLVPKPPLALEAYRAKIGLAGKVCEASALEEPIAHEVKRAGAIVPLATSPTAQKARRKTRRPPASTLLWPRDIFPLAVIEGEPVAVEKITLYKDAKAAELAARFWTRRVAFETAALFPEDQRESVERFVLRHRLSIANAFHRRVVRAAVVKALAELFSVIPVLEQSAQADVANRTVKSSDSLPQRSTEVAGLVEM